MAHTPVFDPTRNTLSNAISPYLQSHADNPVHWQEWSPEACAYAREHNRILFVSVGYSTCHWCHVMAREAFSDASVAAFLNEHFVNIKVDREERPDIDSYMMNFMLATRGQGGWPLNVFLSSAQRPFFAMTYAPVDDRAGMPGFQSILARVLGFYRDKESEIGSFDPQATPGTLLPNTGGTLTDLADRTAAPFDFDTPIRAMSSRFDAAHAGFGPGPRFPPHATLLWLLYSRDILAHLDSAVPETAEATDAMTQRILDVMQQRGLHDHLGGGFFRYCVDEAWTIPHFEKMLYDQAMLLWAYAAAARLYGRDDYARTAHGIATCLNRDFHEDGLYISALDADTDHEEGATYLWTRDEIQEALQDDEWHAFSRAYELPADGNFEGRIHLLRSGAEDGTPGVREAERRLHEIRSRRVQPAADRKHITHWNALAGIGLAYAGRYLDTPAYVEQAVSIADAIARRHYQGGELAHASIGGATSAAAGFLDDHASFALLLTVLEETHPRFTPLRRDVLADMSGFAEGSAWYASRQADFRPVPAETYDQPIPSSVSMADFALARAATLDGVLCDESAPGSPLAEDFRNLSALLRAGLWHIIETPDAPEGASGPLAAVYVRAPEQRHCFAGQCRTGPPPETLPVV